MRHEALGVRLVLLSRLRRLLFARNKVEDQGHVLYAMLQLECRKTMAATLFQMIHFALSSNRLRSCSCQFANFACCHDLT